MSLELVNTIGSLVTVTIVAATAVAALVQLRHLRAGNQINAMLAIGEKFSGREYQDAVDFVTRNLEATLADPVFRDYEIAIWRRLPPPVVEARYLDLHRATIFLGNAFEELGILVKNRIVDQNIFVDQWYGVVLGAWKRLENYVALGREATGENAMWENFEYLTVLSEDWAKRQPSSYPRGARRLSLHSRWAVPPKPRASE